MFKNLQIDLIAQYNCNIGKKDGGKQSGPKGSRPREEQLILDGDKNVSPFDDTIRARSKVSDHDCESVHSVCSSDEEDALIGNLVPVDENVTVDSIINEDYCEQETVPHLPPVDDKLSTLLTKWL